MGGQGLRGVQCSVWELNCDSHKEASVEIVLKQSLELFVTRESAPRRGCARFANRARRIIPDPFYPQAARLKPLERPACAKHEQSQNHDHCQYLIIAQNRSPPRIASCHGVIFPHRQPQFVTAPFAFINSNLCVCVAGRA